jgi:hypothetical protein
MLLPSLTGPDDDHVQPEAERDFWQRRLAPLPDFADVRALPDRSLDAEAGTH